MPIPASEARLREENIALKHVADALALENYKLKRALIDLDLRQMERRRVVDAKSEEP